MSGLESLCVTRLAAPCFPPCCVEDFSDRLQFFNPRYSVYHALGGPSSPEDPGEGKLFFEVELTRQNQLLAPEPQPSLRHTYESR